MVWIHLYADIVFEVSDKHATIHRNMKVRFKGLGAKHTSL